ncbi:hypothetical protein LSH36_119g05016 [Paralvinella palmiformis]|uniref:ascorbate ferrireductase (transmembrane) n=1 Tax=Paralvinella palmiformis TaxID=53620 RepID=A0AAD9NAQ3_9ANNE|nr:hypothetical protein LSH36_119g05016 [Paralvinella palmiformis]
MADLAPESVKSSEVVLVEIGVKPGNSVSLLAMIINMVAHFICVLFSGFVIYTSKPGTTLFSWHPTLMVIAFIFLMAEAILLFSPESSLLKNSDRKKKGKYHWILMLTGLVCSLIGLAVIWYNKELKGRAHATTLHGLVGYIVCCYMAVQCCAGALLLYPTTAGKLMKLSVLKSMHALSGCFLFVLSCLVLLGGLNTKWFSGQVTGTSWYVCVACPLILMSIIVNQVARSVLGRAAGKKTAANKK